MAGSPSPFLPQINKTNGGIALIIEALAPKLNHDFAEVNGIRLHSIRPASESPSCSCMVFRKRRTCGEKSSALAGRFADIAPDLRGCGESDRPSGGYEKRTVAKDIHQLVRHFGLGRVNVVRHDVGTMVSYAYAAAYPAEVRRLVLMEAALPRLGFFEAPNGLAKALIAGREKMFVEHFMLQQTYDPTDMGEEALEEYARRLSAPGALHGGIMYFQSHAIDAQRNRVLKTKLPMPVLTIGAQAIFKDMLAPQMRAAEENTKHSHRAMRPLCCRETTRATRRRTASLFQRDKRRIAEA